MEKINSISPKTTEIDEKVDKFIRPIIQKNKKDGEIHNKKNNFNTFFDNLDKKTNLDNFVTEAFYKKLPEAAEFLIEKGFKVDFYYVDENGRNALHHMIINSSGSKYDLNEYFKKIVIKLLEDTLRGGQYSLDKKILNKQDNLGNTPLHYAVMIENTNVSDTISELLMKNGANYNIKNAKGEFVKMTEEKSQNFQRPQEQKIQESKLQNLQRPQNFPTQQEQKIQNLQRPQNFPTQQEQKIHESKQQNVSKQESNVSEKTNKHNLSLILVTETEKMDDNFNSNFNNDFDDNKNKLNEIGRMLKNIQNGGNSNTESIQMSEINQTEKDSSIHLRQHNGLINNLNRDQDLINLTRQLEKQNTLQKNDISLEENISEEIAKFEKKYKDMSHIGGGSKQLKFSRPLNKDKNFENYKKESENVLKELKKEIKKKIENVMKTNDVEEINKYYNKLKKIVGKNMTQIEQKQEMLNKLNKKILE